MPVNYDPRKGLDSTILVKPVDAPGVFCTLSKVIPCGGEVEHEGECDRCHWKNLRPLQQTCLAAGGMICRYRLTFLNPANGQSMSIDDAFIGCVPEHECSNDQSTFETIVRTMCPQGNCVASRTCEAPCPSGFLWDNTGAQGCVEYNECLADSHSCSANATWYECASSCPPRLSPRRSLYFPVGDTAMLLCAARSRR